MADKRRHSSSSSSLSSEEAGPSNPTRPRLGTDDLLKTACGKLDFCPREGQKPNPKTKCQSQDFVRFAVKYKVKHNMNPFNLNEFYNQERFTEFYDETHPRPRGAASPRSKSRTERIRVVAKCFKEDKTNKLSDAILELFNSYHLNSLILEEEEVNSPESQSGASSKPKDETIKRISMSAEKVKQFEELKRNYRNMLNLDVFKHLKVEEIPSFTFLQESQGLLKKSFYMVGDEQYSTTPKRYACEINRNHNIECASKCRLEPKCTNRKLEACRSKGVEDIKHVYLFQTTDNRGLGLKVTESIGCQMLGEYCGVVKPRGKEPTSPGKWKCGYDIDYDGANTIVCEGKGTFMMFINSTCDDRYANCEILDWYKNGFLTKVIFTKGDVLANTELLLHYGPGHEVPNCVCGAPKCANKSKYKGDPLVEWDKVKIKKSKS